ncbi:MAG: hypothetical protein KGH68_02365 [Patescibacteria group bacterium]|nr:hypothetical protein [Patescibacteria group bacterium]
MIFVAGGLLMLMTVGTLALITGVGMIQRDKVGSLLCVVIGLVLIGISGLAGKKVILDDPRVVRRLSRLE